MISARPETLGWHEVRRDDDGALLGYVQPVADAAEGNGAGDDAWRPLTVFGYPLAPATSPKEATAEVRRRGLESMLDTWYFRSADDGEWYACSIMEAMPNLVRVRVTDYGYLMKLDQEIEAFKEPWFEIENPNPENFRPTRG